MSRLQSEVMGVKSCVLRWDSQLKSRFFRDFIWIYYTFQLFGVGFQTNRILWSSLSPSSCFIKSCLNCFTSSACKSRCKSIQVFLPKKVVVLATYPSKLSRLEKSFILIASHSCITPKTREMKVAKVLVPVYESLKQSTLNSSGWRSRIFLWSGLAFCQNDSGFVNIKSKSGTNWLASFPVGRACSPGPHGPVDGLKHVSWMRTRKPPSLTSFWQLACNWRFKSWGSLGTIQESTADERKRINLNLKEETERLSFEICNHCNPNTLKFNVERFWFKSSWHSKIPHTTTWGPWVPPATTSPRTRAEFEGSLHHAAGFHVPLRWHHTGNLGPLRPWTGSKRPPWQGPKVLSVTIHQCVSQRATSHNLHSKAEKFCLSLRTSMPMRKNGCPQSTS